MMKSVKVVLLLVALCFVVSEAVPSYYPQGGMGFYRPDMIGPFYMGPYCNYKCPMKCWRMGMTGSCENNLCSCTRSPFETYSGGQ